jgi:hypothetical protein
MRTRRHALSGALYDVGEDGLVRVTAKDGTTGVFTPRGEHISGDLHHVDPHLCLWLAGPQLPAEMARSHREMADLRSLTPTTAE